MNAKAILNEILVELFNHILYLEEQNLQIKGINLTMNEIHTIEAIRNVNDASMSNIATKLLITLGTLTTVVKRLEAKGYVERFKEMSDARVVNVRVTQAGKDVLAIHDKFHKDMIETVLNDLTKHEEEVLLVSLVKIKEYFKNKLVEY